MSNRRLVEELHAKGTRVVPYVNLNFLAVPAPEFAYYSPDWLDSARCFNTGDVAQMGGATLGACPRVSAWRDYIATKLARFVDEFGVDGIYVDCWNPSSCMVEDHGCGWRDDAQRVLKQHLVSFQTQACQKIDDPCRDEESVEVVTPELIGFSGHGC